MSYTSSSCTGAHTGETALAVIEKTVNESGLCHSHWFFLQCEFTTGTQSVLRRTRLQVYGVRKHPTYLEGGEWVCEGVGGALVWGVWGCAGLARFLEMVEKRGRGWACGGVEVWSVCGGVGVGGCV